MLESTTILILTALPLMGSPGPATLSIAAAGSAYGLQRSLGYAGGVMLGTATVLLLIATGVTGIVLTVPGLMPVLSVGALAYILYLAYRIATAPVGGKSDPAEAAPVFAGGYLLAVANPKAFAAFGAVFSGVVILPGDAFADAALKTVILSALILLVHGIWLLLGVGLARVMGDPTWGRIINVGFAVLLVVSVAAALLP